ncbi:PP2C family serine/threonine-protein phosphatase [Aerosakkonema funiforme]|uniref:PP2C family serine/threonine-protein phosphatase n=1 Tax=Aerosakkonema funiforme TaxID=1246630 RepID=UPI0035BB0D43
MAWKAVVESAIGTSHKQSQMPCQDYGNYVLLDSIIVGAVADGAGSAKYSDIGAQLAVHTALYHLKGWIEREKKNKPTLDWQQPISDEIAKKVFGHTLKKVIATLNQETTNGYSLNDLACTLLVFVATPKWIAAMQIGDGFIVVNPQNSDYQLLFEPDKGVYANETTFVTSTNAHSQMQVGVLSGNQKFICASTDGLERLAINTRNWKPSARFFDPFEEGLEMRNEAEEAESTKNWLNSDEVNKKTDDDKTLLLCLYQEGQSLIHQPQKKDRYPLVLLIQLSIFNLLAGFFWNFQYHYSFIVLKKGYSAFIGWGIIASSFIGYSFITFKQLQKFFKKRPEKWAMATSLCLVWLAIGAFLFYLSWLYYLSPSKVGI